MSHPLTSNRLDRNPNHPTRANHDQNFIRNPCPTHNGYPNHDQKTSQSLNLNHSNTSCVTDAVIHSLDVTTDHLETFIAVLDEKDVPYQRIKGSSPNPSSWAIQLVLNNKTYTFNHHHIVNDDFTETRLFNNPEYRYQLYNQRIQMPKTIGFMLPDQVSDLTLDDNYPRSLIEIIEKCFSYPVLMKLYSRSVNHCVQTFFCGNQEDILRSLKWINQHTQEEAILITETYISPIKKYQAFCYGEHIFMVNERHSSFLSFQQQSKNADNIFTKNLVKMNRLQKLASPLFQDLDTVFFQVEFIEDPFGEIYLTELTTNPSIESFAKSYIDQNDPTRNDSNAPLFGAYHCMLDHILTASISK